MSNDALKWAMRCKCGSSSAKAVLLVMADAARDKPMRSATGQLWPPLHAWMSQAALAECTEMDRKTIGPALARLESLGLIVRAGSEGATRQITVYLLRANVPENGGLDEAPKEPESGSVSRDQGEHERAPVSEGKDPALGGKGSRFPLESTPKTGHETLLNPEGTLEEPKKKSRTRAPASPPPDGVDPQVWADWLVVRKAKRGGPVTATALDGLRREAGRAGIGIEDAVRFCVEANWVGFNAGWYADQMTKRGSGGGDYAAPHRTSSAAQRSTQPDLAELTAAVKRRLGIAPTRSTDETYLEGIADDGRIL